MYSKYKQTHTHTHTHTGQERNTIILNKKGTIQRKCFIKQKHRTDIQQLQNCRKHVSRIEFIGGTVRFMYNTFVKIN